MVSDFPGKILPYLNIIFPHFHIDDRMMKLYNKLHAFLFINACYAFMNKKAYLQQQFSNFYKKDIRLLAK